MYTIFICLFICILFYMPLFLCAFEMKMWLFPFVWKGWLRSFHIVLIFFHPIFSLLYPISAPICNSIKPTYNVLFILQIIVTGIFYALLCEFSPSDIFSYAVFEFCTWFNDIKWCREIYMLCSLSNELEAWQHPICTDADTFSGHTWPITCEP